MENAESYYDVMNLEGQKGYGLFQAKIKSDKSDKSCFFVESVCFWLFFPSVNHIFCNFEYLRSMPETGLKFRSCIP